MKIKISTKLCLFLLVSLTLIGFLVGTFRTSWIVQETDELLKLSININNKFKQISPGEEILAEINLQFSGNVSETKDVYVTCVIKDLEGNIIAVKSETLAIWTRASSIVQIYIPKDTEIGDYLFYAKAKYNGVEAEASDSFKVVKSQDKKVVLTYDKIILILVILALIILVLFLIYYKIKKLKNKKI